MQAWACMGWYDPTPLFLALVLPQRTLIAPQGPTPLLNPGLSTGH